MENNHTPGVAVISKFVLSSSKEFKSYINYIDRKEAVRNNNFNRYSLYEEYMGNPEKTTSLFDNYSNCMSFQSKKKAKELFKQAQDNGSILWQDVFSFDNNWLVKQGIYNSLSKELDENKIKNAVRKSINYSLYKQGIKESAIWNGAIHYNTDNIHVHVAICEPIPSQSRGKRTQKTLDDMKSVFVNELVNSRENYLEINRIIRDKIIGKKDERSLINDKEMKKLMRNVIANLPADKRQWYYGYNTMKASNSYLDKMTSYYISTYKKNEFNTLVNLLDEQEEILKEIYGVGKREKYKDYKKNKIDDLYRRMGNAILSEIKTSLKEPETHFKGKKNLLISKNVIKKIEKALGSELDNAKNINEYKRLNYAIDNNLEI